MKPNLKITPPPSPPSPRRVNGSFYLTDTLDGDSKGEVIYNYRTGNVKLSLPHILNRAQFDLLVEGLLQVRWDLDEAQKERES